MYTLNQLTIIGFTGNEADIHYTANGTLAATLSVATKQSWKDAEDAWQSRTDWHRVVIFGKVAEYARTIAKGSSVMVQGPVRTREYEKDGLRNRVFELRAETIGKVDRTERQEPATGTEDFDA
jgi:single-strand DNA-binding protein